MRPVSTLNVPFGAAVSSSHVCLRLCLKCDDSVSELWRCSHLRGPSRTWDPRLEQASHVDRRCSRSRRLGRFRGRPSRCPSVCATKSLERINRSATIAPASARTAATSKSHRGPRRSWRAPLRRRSLAPAAGRARSLGVSDRSRSPSRSCARRPTRIQHLVRSRSWGGNQRPPCRRSKDCAARLVSWLWAPRFSPPRYLAGQRWSSMRASLERPAAPGSRIAGEAD